MVDFFEVLLNLAGGQTTGIERENQVVKALKAGLAFGDDPRLEGRLAVAGHLDRESTEVAFESLPGLAVAGVALVVAVRRMFLIGEGECEFCLHGPLTAL